MIWIGLMNNTQLANWILLTTLHSILIGALGFIILHIWNPRSPAVKSSWCVAVVCLLICIPILSKIVPKSKYLIPITETKKIISLPYDNADIGIFPDETMNEKLLINPEQIEYSNDYILLHCTVPKTDGRIATVIFWGIVWAVISAGLIMRICFELAFLMGYRSGLVEITDERIVECVQSVKQYYKFRREPKIYISPKLTTPISIGIRDPIVILPEKLYKNMIRDEIRTVLLHELAHISHFDHLLGLCLRFLKALYWWNPFIYYLSRSHMIAREDVSDNYAIAEMKNQNNYAMLLVSLAEKTCLISKLPCTSGMANPSVPLEKRIRNILSKERNMCVKTNINMLVVIFLLTAFLGTLVIAGNQTNIFSSSELPCRQIDEWYKAGNNPEACIISKDTNVFFKDSPSYSLESRSSDEDDIAVLMSTMEPCDYFGKKIRMTAYIKTENIDGQAGMWMRVNEFGRVNSIISDDMRDRPIEGTTDWTLYEIILEVPKTSTDIVYGAHIKGKGKLWIDDVYFEAVEDLPSTGFSYLQRIDDWFQAGSKPTEYRIKKDKSIFNSAPDSIMMESISDSINGFGTVMTNMKPDEYRGHRVRMSAFIRSEDVKDWAGMWMRVDGKEYGKTFAFDNMQNRSIKGTTDWTLYEIVLDVAPESRNIAYGVLVHDTGRIWLDDVQFEIVDENTPVTDFYAKIRSRRIDSWILAGSEPTKYRIKKDESIFNSAPDSIMMESISDSIAGFGTVMTSMKADEYFGQRVRMSAYIRSEDVNDWAGMWMRVDGKEYGKSLAFDNMQNRSIKGTTDWTLYEIVLDVSPESKNIAYGVLVSDTGRIWLDDVQFEIVDENVETTDLQAFRLSRRIDGWFLTGTKPDGYRIRKDKSIFNSAPDSIMIESITDSIEGFGNIMKNMGSRKYHGQRVRMSAYIRSEDVIDWAGMWMRVDGIEPGKFLAFDNMQNRSIKGTTDWTFYEIVLDVAPESISIAYGILISDTGRIWFDDVQFEIVDENVPTTDIDISKLYELNEKIIEQTDIEVNDE